jgi:hypothetical protein
MTMPNCSLGNGVGCRLWLEDLERAERREPSSAVVSPGMSLGVPPSCSIDMIVYERTPSRDEGGRRWETAEELDTHGSEYMHGSSNYVIGQRKSLAPHPRHTRVSCICTTDCLKL